MKTLLQFLAIAMTMVLLPAAGLAELEGLAYLPGRWAGQVEIHEGGEWKPAGATRATVDTGLGGAFYRLRATIPFPGETYQFEAIFSQDRFNGGYRAVFMDDVHGFMDVYTGDIVDAVLILDNRETGTSYPDGQGGRVYGKVDVGPLDDGFLFVTYISDDPSAGWTPYLQVRFSSLQR